MIYEYSGYEHERLRFTVMKKMSLSKGKVKHNKEKVNHIKKVIMAFHYKDKKASFRTLSIII